jgi:hypothetical protein
VHAQVKNARIANDDKRTLPRLLNALRQTWRRRLLYGLLSVRFLFPASNPWINLHRDLHLSTSNAWRAFFTVANIWLALRWLMWSAWRASSAAVHNHGLAAQDAGAQSPAAQRRAILRLALLHSIPPQAWYQYQLWQPSKDFWAYVYDSELPQFHQFYNGNVKGAGARLLADKWLFPQTAAAHGIAITPSLGQLDSGRHATLLALLQHHSAVFCKPRFGNASIGAFAVVSHDDIVQVKLLEADIVLLGDEATEAIRNLLSGHDYVVQPLLLNHHALQVLCDQQTHGFPEAISVRVLSRRQHGRVDLFCAYLEIPRHDNGRKQHALIAVDCDDGSLRTDDDNWHYRQLRQRQPQLLSVATGIVIPYWEQTRAQAQAAHALVEDINIVAWDFIVTDVGAVLLEGNVNWRVSPPQILFGPLLPRLFVQ